MIELLSEELLFSLCGQNLKRKTISSQNIDKGLLNYVYLKSHGIVMVRPEGPLKFFKLRKIMKLVLDLYN